MAAKKKDAGPPVCTALWRLDGTAGSCNQPATTEVLLNDKPFRLHCDEHMTWLMNEGEIVPLRQYTFRLLNEKSNAPDERS